MTREEAVERIKDHMFVHKIYEERAVKITEALEMAIFALEQPEQRWIPCSERLPEPNERNEDVLKYRLVQNEYGDMMVATFRMNKDGEAWWEQMYTYAPTKDEIVAWMPLPEPYRKEGGE